MGRRPRRARRRARRTSKSLKDRAREERRRRRRDARKMRKRRERGKIVCGVEWVSPKVEFVKRRGAGRAGKDVADGVAIVRTFRA